MMKRCAFTGHRKDFGDFDKGLLDRVILNLIHGGTDEFLCGMALGFDLAAAEIVLKYKKIYPVRLIACIPCEEQSKFFNEKTAEKYHRILGCCDDRIVLAPRYFSGCMHARDRFMVDNCDVLVCYLRKNYGGTFYTVSYAKKRGVKIIEV